MTDLFNFAEEGSYIHDTGCKSHHWKNLRQTVTVNRKRAKKHAGTNLQLSQCCQLPPSFVINAKSSKPLGFYVIKERRQGRKAAEF